MLCFFHFLFQCPQCHHTSDPMGDVTTFKCNALIQNGNKKTIDKKMMQSCLNCKVNTKLQAELCEYDQIDRLCLCMCDGEYDQIDRLCLCTYHGH